MNILLTSVGRRSYMVTFFKEALKGLGQVHVANSAETYAFSLADFSVVTPIIYDENYINYLLNYCIENKIDAIISLFDIDLPVLAKNKSKFASMGVQVVISDYEFTQICNDKWQTYQFLKKHNFNVPKTYLSINECKIELGNKLLKFPLIIKPRWGMASIGIFEADDHIELDVLFKKTKKTIFESYLKYESFLAPDNCIIIQEKLLGQEYGMDILNDLNGNFLTCVPKKKLAMRAGETDSAEIIENFEMFELGRKLSEKAKHVGNLDVDCFYVSGRFYILEMNCRFGGQYPFAHLAGANFPKAIVKMLMKQPVDDNLIIFNPGTIGVKDLVPVKLVK